MPTHSFTNCHFPLFPPETTTEVVTVSIPTLPPCASTDRTIPSTCSLFYCSIEKSFITRENVSQNFTDCPSCNANYLAKIFHSQIFFCSKVHKPGDSRNLSPQKSFSLYSTHYHQYIQQLKSLMVDSPCTTSFKSFEISSLPALRPMIDSACNRNWLCIPCDFVALSITFGKLHLTPF